MQVGNCVYIGNIGLENCHVDGAVVSSCVEIVDRKLLVVVDLVEVVYASVPKETPTVISSSVVFRVRSRHELHLQIMGIVSKNVNDDLVVAVIGSKAVLNLDAR